MKKERFKEIVNSYSSTPDEIRSLKKLASDYPFSQILHLLLANASKNEDKSSFKQSLSKAAFHSTDRSILKSLIEHNLVPSEIAGPKSKTATGSKDLPLRTVSKSDKIDSDALRAEVLENLSKLIQVKKEASTWFDDEKTQKPSKKKTPSAKKTKLKPKVETKPNSKVLKQSTIIDKFIEEEPTISKNSKSTNAKEDLSVKSGKMRDDVVSESLAKIFVSQGKTEKAIEIYKKLIWKLPQKKALFAAQIDKLKKK